MLKKYSSVLAFLSLCAEWKRNMSNQGQNYWDDIEDINAACEKRLASLRRESFVSKKIDDDETTSEDSKSLENESTLDTLTTTPSTGNQLPSTNLYPDLNTQQQQFSQSADIQKRKQNDTRIIDESLVNVLHQMREMFVISRELDSNAPNTTQYLDQLYQYDEAIESAEAEIQKPLAQPSPANTYKCQRQLEFLQNRHEEFKKAAIQARDNGNKQEAMSFMKTMKAIQDMINHTKNGLPSDISKVPPAPIPSQPALGTIQGSQKRTPAHATLLHDLEEQLKKAKTLSKTFTALKDLDRASTIDKWASNTFRDITALKYLTAQGRTIPDVIWETRRVKSIKLFTYIEPNQCEIKIENLLEMPKEFHNERIFVQVLFPYPREPECVFKTQVFKAEQNTKIDFENLVAIDRKKSAFKRALERKPLQFEVFKKGGIFSSDKSILKSAMMITELETECEICKVIPLLANKKPVAKIQVRVRLREPMEKAQVVEEEIQWAVLDSVKAKKPAGQKPAAITSVSSKKTDLPKMKPKSVLKYEISVELGFAEKAKQLRNREKIEQHTQKLQSLQDELSRTREYAKSHPSNYKLICANYVERCMSFLNMAQEQGWTDRIAEVSAKIQHSKGELATLSPTNAYQDTGLHPHVGKHNNHSQSHGTRHYTSSSNENSTAVIKNSPSSDSRPKNTVGKLEFSKTTKAVKKKQNEPNTKRKKKAPTPYNQSGDKSAESSTKKPPKLLAQASYINSNDHLKSHPYSRSVIGKIDDMDNPKEDIRLPAEETGVNASAAI